MNGRVAATRSRGGAELRESGFKCLSENGFGKRPWLKLQAEGKIVVEGEQVSFPARFSLAV